MQTLDVQIEAVLFYKAEPLKESRLAELLGVDAEALSHGLAELESKLQGRGVSLMRKDGEVFLASSSETGPLIEKIAKDELSRDLGNAAIETLTIVLYKGPIQKSEIDFIRGVNSNFILRNLLVRGLVEKIPNPLDQRSFLYRPTFDLLSHLGISKREDLPEFDEFREKVEASIAAFAEHSEEEKIPAVSNAEISEVQAVESTENAVDEQPTSEHEQHG